MHKLLTKQLIFSAALVLAILPFALSANGAAFLFPSSVFSLGGGSFSSHVSGVKSRASAPEESLSKFGDFARAGAASFALSAKGAVLDFALSLDVPPLTPFARGVASLEFQEPGQPPPPEPPPSPSSSSKHPKPKYSHANDFLIRGTVFTDKALSFPGVQLRIRRAGEKKFRWQDSTNSRGEFAIRVPQDAQYEVVVHAKGFADQTKTIDAKKGLTEEKLSFRMEPQGGKK